MQVLHATPHILHPQFHFLLHLFFSLKSTTLLAFCSSTNLLSNCWHILCTSLNSLSSCAFNFSIICPLLWNVFGLYSSCVNFSVKSFVFVISNLVSVCWTFSCRFLTNHKISTELSLHTVQYQCIFPFVCLANISYSSSSISSETAWNQCLHILHSIPLWAPVTISLHTVHLSLIFLVSAMHFCFFPIF